MFFKNLYISALKLLVIAVFLQILFKLGTAILVVIAWASLLAKIAQSYLPWGVSPQKFGFWGLERSNFSEIPSSSPLIR